MVGSVLEVTAKVLKEEEWVTLAWFGTFSVVHKPGCCKSQRKKIPGEPPWILAHIVFRPVFYATFR